MTYLTQSAPAAERPQGPQKSPQAFRTISEVAEDLDVPPHVLRFWESRFVQIRPLKRGGGRRYYRPGDVDLLRGIKRLLHEEGMTIKGAQKMMREKGVRFIADIGRGEGPDAIGDALPAAAAAGADMVPENAAGRIENRETANVQRPLLTPEKRANLEAALSVLSDLRKELSSFARSDGTGDSRAADLS